MLGLVTMSFGATASTGATADGARPGGATGRGGRCGTGGGDPATPKNPGHADLADVRQVGMARLITGRGAGPAAVRR